MPTTGRIWYIILGTYREWLEDGIWRVAAALSYFAIFAIAPLLVIAIAIAGVFLGTTAAQSEVTMQLQSLIGQEAARTLLDMIRGFRDTGSNWLTTLIGIGVLFFASTNLFFQTQHFLNQIWGIEETAETSLMRLVRRRLLAFLMVLVLGFFLLLAILLSALVGAFMRSVPMFVQMELLIWLAEVLLSMLVFTALFAMLYNVLPDAEINWRYVLPGAIFTAVLFQVGQMLFSAYLSRSNITSTYGAAGSFMVLLMWVYYSMNIFLIGAEFTQVYAHHTASDEAIGRLSADATGEMMSVDSG